MVETSTTETTAAETNQNLWYAGIENEIVDNNSSEEKELVKEINASLSGLECWQLADNSLEKLTKEQLSTFLMKNYFEWWAKSYADCKNSWDILNFSMKAALQFLSGWDTKKYDESWKVSEDDDAKSIDEWMKEKWWITLDEDSTLVKILQNKVWAVPDWKVWPQTIALTIWELGGDIATIWASVDSFYGDNEKFKVLKTITLNNVEYKYSPSIKINIKGNWTYIWETIIDLSWETPTCDWYTFVNGVIKKVWWAASENASESADANMKEFSHGWFKFKYDDNNIYVSNGNSGDIYLLKKPINQNPTQNKLTISNLVPYAQWFEFVKNGDGNDYTIKLEWEDNFKDSVNIVDKNIRYNKDEVEVRSNSWFIQIKRKWSDDNSWKTLTPADGNGFQSVDGFLIKVTDDWTINIRLKNNLETLEDERNDALEKLNWIKFMWHKLAFKIDGKWINCAYYNSSASSQGDDKISTQDSSGKIFRYDNKFSRDLYDKVDLTGGNYMNLQNITYKEINNVRNSKIENGDKDIRWAVDEYIPSKKWWIEGNRILLWKWCRNSKETNWIWYKWWDFLYFCETVGKKCGIAPEKFTVWAWMTLVQIMHNNNYTIDKIQNIAIA